jgi:hypothetical protein
VLSISYLNIEWEESLSTKERQTFSLIYDHLKYPCKIIGQYFYISSVCEVWLISLLTKIFVVIGRNISS